MELNLKIEVFEILRHPAGTQKLLVRNSFLINSSVSFDYESLVAGIRLLYSNKPLVITFSIFSNDR